MKTGKLLAFAIVAILIQATIVTFVQAVLPQNDAGYGGDAGNTAQGSFRVYGNHSYTGTLDPPTPASDTDDYYNFTVYYWHWINITMIPPPNADYDMRLIDPGQNTKATSKNATGVPEKIAFRATANGIWFLHIYCDASQPGGNYTFSIEPLNFPPSDPATPYGPATGYVYENYDFSTFSTDANGDSIRYTFNWSDGTTSLTSWCSSGVNASATHSFKKPITYNITAQATDAHNNVSGWSPVHTIKLNQSDGGSHHDAGNTPATALIISDPYNGTVYSSKGTLYDPLKPEKDRTDYYNFTAAVGDLINVSMTPPTGQNFSLILVDPHGNQYSATQPGDQKKRISLIADIAGEWCIGIFISGTSPGEGQYSFTLALNVLTATLTVAVSSSPPEGVTITIDDVPYTAFKGAPVTVELAQGQHTIHAQEEYYTLGPGGTWYCYVFYQWSDDVHANPRTINLTQNLTLTAQYIRERFPS